MLLSQSSGNLQSWRTSLMRLLRENFQEQEIIDLAHEMDVDYKNLVGLPFASKTRELIIYLERRERLLKLIGLCEQKKPGIDWESIRQGFLKQRSMRLIQTSEQPKPSQRITQPNSVNLPNPQQKTQRPITWGHFPPLLLKYFDLMDLAEICFDAAVEFEMVAGISLEEKVKGLVTVLEAWKEAGIFRQVKLFALALSQRQPAVNWPELMGLSLADLKGYVVQRIYKGDGTAYDTAVIRQLLQDVFQNNDQLLTFCENWEDLWRSLRQGMSIEMSFRQNIQALLEGAWRRGRFPDMLKTLQEIDPEKYSAVSHLIYSGQQPDE